MKTLDGHSQDIYKYMLCKSMINLLKPALSIYYHYQLNLILNTTIWFMLVINKQLGRDILYS